MDPEVGVIRSWCAACDRQHTSPALWLIQTGRGKPPPCAPMWLRLGKESALRTLSKMHDQLTAAKP